MTGMKGRIPISISGDLHAIGIGKILRAGNLSLEANQLTAVLCPWEQGPKDGLPHAEVSAPLPRPIWICARKSNPSSSTGSRSPTSCRTRLSCVSLNGTSRPRRRRRLIHWSPSTRRSWGVQRSAAVPPEAAFWSRESSPRSSRTKALRLLFRLLGAANENQSE